jgi:hypothetical protein
MRPNQSALQTPSDWLNIDYEIPLEGVRGGDA